MPQPPHSPAGTAADNRIDPSIYRYILKHTRRDQLLILLLTLATMPLVYASLEVPKIIINRALSGNDIPAEMLGFPVTQFGYLLALCFVFLALVVGAGALKYVNNVYRGVVGERMLRRFRYDLFARLLRFPLPHFKQVSQGEILPMVTAETEPLGGFIGDAFALPAFQGGLLLTYLFFIFNQDVWLGLAAIALYPPQLYVIPKLQLKVNALAKQRVQAVRRLSDRVGESLAGMPDIHVNDTSHFERARVSGRLGIIYAIRMRIYRRKFFIKFLNNFLAQLTPFFFYSIGGYFVIQGELSLGALVAVLAAHKELDSPWKELLKFYQITEDVRVKYRQIIDQFQPPGMLDPALQQEPATEPALAFAEAELAATALRYSEDDHVQSLDRVGFTFPGRRRIAILGAGGRGRDDLARLLARLTHPDSGQLRIGGVDMAGLSEATLGRRMAYVDQQSYVFTGAVRDNLLYGLKHRQVAERPVAGEAAAERARDIAFARLADNSTDDPEAEWIDPAALGFADADTFDRHLFSVLAAADLEEDVYQLGLYSSVRPDEAPALAAGVLAVRRRLREVLAGEEYRSLVDLLSADAYNPNLTVAENLFFGVPRRPGADYETLLGEGAVRAALARTGIEEPLVAAGLEAAGVLGEMFADVPEGSPLFEQFSLVDAEDLPRLAQLGKRAGEGGEALAGADRDFILNLALQLTVARHRLGLITPEIREQVVQAHAALRAELGDPNDHVEFFDVDRIAGRLSVQDNLLFGRPAYGQANAQQKLGVLMHDVIGEAGIRRHILDAGLAYDVGVGGARLTSAQRQKLTLARALVKQPEILVINEATTLFDKKAEQALLDNLLADGPVRTVIWVLGNADHIDRFDQVLVLANGRVLADAPPAEIRAKPDVLASLD